MSLGCRGVPGRCRVTPAPYLEGMYAAVTSVALVGVDPRPVRVEAHVGGGRASFQLVGLPDTAIREAKERVRPDGGTLVPGWWEADMPTAEGITVSQTRQ
jgi:hypothetical protein